MDKRELDMYKLEDAIKALLENTPIKQIARMQRISKNTVKKYRNQLQKILDNNPGIETDLGAVLLEFKNIRKKERYSENFGWLEENKDLVDELANQCKNYVRLSEVLQSCGYKGSYSSFMRYVSKHIAEKERPVFRIETKAGEIAQVDFGYVGNIYDRNKGEKVKAYVFVLILSYSRDAYYEIVTSQDIRTWCSCHIHAFEHFTGVPEIIIPDNLKSAIIKASYCDPLANRSYSDLARHYGFKIDPCIPGTPEHKGKVESGVKYIKNNFIPLRTFKDIEDANEQLKLWNEETARIRVHGTTRRKPVQLFEKYEKETLSPLPVHRFEIPVWKHLKVGRDIHIQFDKSYYSVPHTLKGEYVDARKTDTQITIFDGNDLVAAHKTIPAGKRITNKDHYPADLGNYILADTEYCLKEADGIGIHTKEIVKYLLKDNVIRDLRAAQKIIGLKEKYSRARLESSCKRACFFNNFTYSGVKEILDKELDLLNDTNPLEEIKLCDEYARSFDELINEEAV